MPSPNPRPSAEDRIRAALWFAEHGFGVFPCWSTHADGTCRCPQGKTCTSPGKHPITHDGFKSATTDPAKVRTFLSAASDPNYGVIAPEGVFVLDVDGDDWQARIAALEAQHGPLPPTLRTETAHGQHIFLRWPTGHPRPLRQLFGWVTRWGSGAHAGYVIGPRSVHATGFEYHPATGAVGEIATLPEAWATAGVADDSHRHIRVQNGPRLEQVGAGGRHEFLRDRARTLRGGGLTGESLFGAVMAVNEEYCVPPKSDEEVRRAIGDVETKFEADPLPGTPEYEEHTGGSSTGMLVSEDPEAMFPAPPHEAAYGGLLGDCTRFLLEGTDASPVAVLASLVAFCGALMPSLGYWHGRHPSSPYLAIVGQSGDGRKGTAMTRVVDALGYTLGTDTVNRVKFDGIASGEGLVKALLDRKSETFGNPTGVLFEEEYETFLTAAGREGSNLDSRVRAAFDGKQLSLRKVSERVVVPEPYYLSFLVGITPIALRKAIKRSAFTDGSGNRVLWLPVVRRPVRVMSTEPIFPLDLSRPLIEAHRKTFNDPARIDPTPEANDLLSDYDDYLRANAVGTAARLTRRFGVLAFRMGLVHAAVERSRSVEREHIARAIALTDYALRGLTYAFGHAAGDADATHLLRMLRDSETGELSMTDLKHDFIREPIRRQAALDELQDLGLADVVKVRTRGRPATLLRLKAQEQAFGDFGALLDERLDPGSVAHAQGDSHARPKVPKGAPKVPKVKGSDSIGTFGTDSGSATKTDDKSVNPVPKPDSRSDKHGKSRPKGVPKVSESQPVEPADATGVWAKPCREYASHQASHRSTPRGWVCIACDPPEEEEPS